MVGQVMVCHADISLEPNFKTVKLKPLCFCFNILKSYLPVAETTKMTKRIRTTVQERSGADHTYGNICYQSSLPHMQTAAVC